MSDARANIKAIFLAALEMESPQERSAHLDRVCKGDHQLRARVEALLKAHAEAGNFLETPAIEKETISAGSPVIEGPGTVIGRYKLLEQIGEGGFAVVYMAQQTRPVRRKAALKIVKLGMDTKQVIGRFEAERQALAMMDHPNIAQVLDAGTTESGRPYFVMELVRGIPITEYCDKANLSTRERLGLFIDVCHALQHAHQKGVIHRDVKPTNVLVTLHDGTPVPKVIDFGIAKALGRPLTDKTLFTEFRQFVGTPEYMSPEQAQLGGLDLDTRCDIYALGVLLYELLTGTTPFDPAQLRSAGYEEILRTIRETDPPKPSTRVNTLGKTLTEVATHRQVEPGGLGRLLRGDLDWIVMRCLRKDRTRRYETANGLAEDIQRHLSHQPVLAGPPHLGYRIQKFVRRHRTGVAAGLLVAAALVLGLVAATVGFLQASHEREGARREAARAARAERDAVNQRDRAEAQRGLAEEQRRAAEAQRKTAQEQRRAAEVQRLRAQRLLATSQLDRGLESLNEGSGLGLLDLLEARANVDEIPELRDSIARLWAIGHALWADSLVHVLGRSYVAAFSPDGKLLATSDRRRVQLWDLATGRPHSPPSSELENWPYTVLFSPDGKLLVAHSPWGSARLFDAATGKPVGPVLRHDCGPARPEAFKIYQLSAAFSPDGKLLATGWIDGVAQLWRTDTFKPRGPLLRHEGEVRTVAFSPDGKLLATGSADRTARLWDVATGQPHGSPMRHEPYGPGVDPSTAQVTRVAFSPDGKLLAAASHQHFVYLWETDTGRLRKRLKHEGLLMDLAFGPDGKLLATCTTNSWEARLWDTATGEPHGEPMKHRGRVYTVQFSPDGKTLVTGSQDTVWFWDTATGRPSGRQPWHQGAVYAALGPDGTYVATVTEGPSTPVRIWRARPRPHARLLPRPTAGPGPRCIPAFSRDSRLLAAAWGTTVRLWEPATGQPYGHELEHPSDVTFLAFGRGADVLLVGSKDGPVRLWNPRSGQRLDRQFLHQGPIHELAVSVDGTTVATAAAADKKVCLWEMATGKPLRPPLDVGGSVRWPTFSPDGKLLVAVDGQGSQVWDVAAGRRCRNLETPAHSELVAFSPDGKCLAMSAGSAVKFVDVATGEGAAPRLPHPEPARALAYSPDGAWLATGSEVDVHMDADRVRLWDVAGGPPYRGLVLPTEAARGLLAFSPDGKWLASGYLDGSVRLWRVPTAPTDLREIRIVTWVALGVRRDAEGRDTPVPWQEWQELRDWQRLLDRAGGPEQHGEALDACEKAVSAAAHGRKGRWQEAARDYSKAVELMPSHWRLWSKRADAHVRLKQYAEAIADLTKAIELRPEDWEVWKRRSGVHRRLKQWDKAIADLTEAIELSPKAAGLWQDRAWTRQRLGDSLRASGRTEQAEDEFRQALADFSEAIKLRSTSTRAWNERGIVHYRLRQWEKAIADFTKAIELKPDDPVLWSNRAGTHVKLGESLRASDQTEQAEEQFRKALADYSEPVKLRPKDWEVWNRRGGVHCRLKQWKEALADFTKAIELKPDHPGLRSGRAMVQAELGHWDAASADFSKAVELKPDGAWYRYAQALTRLGAGDMEGYRRACAAILERFAQTEDADAAHWAAWTCILAPGAVADPDQPVRLAAKAVSRGTGVSSVYTLAAAQYRAGRFGQATSRLAALSARWDRAGEVPTGTSPANTWFFLAMARHRLGHADKAREYFDKAVKRAEEDLRPEAGAPWWRRLTLGLFRREAEALLGAGPTSAPAAGTGAAPASNPRR